MAASKLPFLKCVHIIGRPEVPLTESSIEGELLNLLAKHALVLTLQVKKIQMPLDFPTLQHLVVDIDSAGNYRHWKEGHIDVTLFKAISMLKGLRTLYLQSSDWRPICAADLTGCVHLTHVAMQGVSLLAEDKLSLPEGCRLHACSEITLVDLEITEYVAPLVTGLTIRNNPGAGCEMCSVNTWYDDWLLLYTPRMQKLKQLRLHMTEECIDEESKKDGVLKVHFKSGLTPNLEVLEMEMPCGVDVEMDPIPPLKLLVLNSTGTLQLHELIRQAPHTLKQCIFNQEKHSRQIIGKNWRSRVHKSHGQG